MLGAIRPDAASDALGRWHQAACAFSGLAVAIGAFWAGYGLLTGMLSGFGLLTGTALVATFFTIWGVSWAASEHVACRRIR
jgi:hypothetical protein